MFSGQDWQVDLPFSLRAFQSFTGDIQINLDSVAPRFAPKAILKGAWYTNRWPQALLRP